MTPATLTRPQHLEALDRANRVRSERARIKRDVKEFERWADAIDERVRSGLTLEEATVTRSLTRGPRRVDALAALGMGNTNQTEDHQ